MSTSKDLRDRTRRAFEENERLREENARLREELAKKEQVANGKL